MADYIDREAARNAVLGYERWTGIDELPIEFAETEIDKLLAADVVDGALFRDCRRELCLRCGEYRLRYKGACDGCRWMEVQDGG